MPSLEHIARKVYEFRDSGSVELNPKRMRRLKQNLQLSKQVVEINAGIGGGENPHVRTNDFEEVGSMDYLLQSFFPDGNVLKELKSFSDFVARFKGIDGYSEAYVDKLARDSKALRGNDPIGEWESPVYARGLVDVLQAGEDREEESKLVAMVDGNELYKESIPLNVFPRLPQGARVVFNYGEQGLELDLKGTLGDKSSTESTRIEKAVLESMRDDERTRAYIDLVYQDINQMISEK